MFRKRLLACSFCGKSAANVGKLVAGRKAYICDHLLLTRRSRRQSQGPV